MHLDGCMWQYVQWSNGFLMADVFMVFLFLVFWLYVCFMIAVMYGSQHLFTCT